MQDGQQHDLVCTSTLRRAIRTACLILSGTDQCWLPLVKDVRLNEQHSGALTGKNKAEVLRTSASKSVGLSTRPTAFGRTSFFHVGSCP